MGRLSLISYNIHKGLSIGNVKKNLPLLKNEILNKDIDLIFLQEVCGDHQSKSKVIEDFHNNAQYEYLANDKLKHFVYGENATYTKGHHGNAILSRFPILYQKNLDLSLTKNEKRGLLHVCVEDYDKNKINLFCTHINLLHSHRLEQLEKIIYYISKNINPNEKIIFCGDFNDWTQKVSPILKNRINLSEAFLSLLGNHARTFPSFYPVLRLDRIYYKNLSVEKVTVLKEKNWQHLSDHLGIYAEFNY